VFPPETNLRLIRQPERITGAGIGDNAAGLAALLGLVWLLRERGILLMIGSGAALVALIEATFRTSADSLDMAIVLFFLFKNALGILSLGPLGFGMTLCSLIGMRSGWASILSQ